MIKCQRCGLTEEKWAEYEKEFYDSHTTYMEQVECSSCHQTHYRPEGGIIVSPFGDNTCVKCGELLPKEGQLRKFVDAVYLGHDCRDPSAIGTYKFEEV